MTTKCSITVVSWFHDSACMERRCDMEGTATTMLHVGMRVGVFAVDRPSPRWRAAPCRPHQCLQAFAATRAPRYNAVKV